MIYWNFLHYTASKYTQANLINIKPDDGLSTSTIILFHNEFSPSSEQLEKRVSAHTLWQPTFVCIAIIYKYCCFTKHGYIITNLTTKSLGVYYWYVKIPRCGYIEHGLKDVAFYVQKHIEPWAVCYTPLLVLYMPLGAHTFVKLIYWVTLLGHVRHLQWQWWSNLGPDYAFDWHLTHCGLVRPYLGQNWFR